MYFGCGGDLSGTKCINDTSLCLKDYSMQQFDNIYISVFYSLCRCVSEPMSVLGPAQGFSFV